MYIFCFINVGFFCEQNRIHIEQIAAELDDECELCNKENFLWGQTFVFINWINKQTICTIINRLHC